MIDCVNNNKSKNYFYYSDKDSRDFGIYISGYKTFDSPKREYEPISIPGRNGDLMKDKGHYANVSIEYTAFVYPLLPNIEHVREWLFSDFGYNRLEDTYHPDEYYEACFDEALEIEIDPDYEVGQFSLKFNRKPQRFLKDGEHVKTFTATNGTIVNPTNQTARPVLRIFGATSSSGGTVTVSGKAMTLLFSGNEYIEIDCEAEDAYSISGSTVINCNQFVTLPSDGAFPVLMPGENTIHKTAGISKIEIIPRWWRV